VLPPPDPRSLCPLSSTEFVDPPSNKISGYATAALVSSEPKAANSHRIEGGVGPRADLDAFEKIKISCLFWKSNSNSYVSGTSICNHGMFQKNLCIH